MPLGASTYTDFRQKATGFRLKLSLSITIEAYQQQMRQQG
jgi:hypothetical protein